MADDKEDRDTNNSLTVQIMHCMFNSNIKLQARVDLADMTAVSIYISLTSPPFTTVLVDLVYVLHKTGSLPASSKFQDGAERSVAP